MFKGLPFQIPLAQHLSLTVTQFVQELLIVAHELPVGDLSGFNELAQALERRPLQSPHRREGDAHFFAKLHKGLPLQEPSAQHLLMAFVQFLQAVTVLPHELLIYAEQLVPGELARGASAIVLAHHRQRDPLRSHADENRPQQPIEEIEEGGGDVVENSNHEAAADGLTWAESPGIIEPWKIWCGNISQ